MTEMRRLRDRIKMLETDNATMHMKLSKTQQDVNQRLTEIEMQIGPDVDSDDVFRGRHDDDSPGGGGDDSGASARGHDEDNENNIESFI